MKIFLIGYRCTGKTTIGKILAKRFNLSFIDIDRLVEQHAGSSISEIVETCGWEKFRRMEKEMLFSIQDHQDYVVATGGGIILDSENQIFIKKNGLIIWLDADMKTILHRINTDNQNPESRPSLTKKDIREEILQVMEQRRPLYRLTADMRIDTSLLSPKEIINIIDRRL